MCGIAGAVLLPGQALSAAQADAASRALLPRGPDDLGFLGWSESSGLSLSREPAATAGARVALVHRRLAILDLSANGWQPMSSPDGRFHLVYNGEIYNYLELRAELERRGHRFRSRSDTEVLLVALAEWGVAALPRLVGMFAFAWLDLTGRRLWLVRDFFGIKPLYYAADARGLAFASEIKALRALTGATPAVDPVPLYHYLRFGVTDHGPDTLFAGIRQLPPAHYLEVSLDQARPGEPQAYWQPDLSLRCDLDFDAAAGRLRELFLDSVRLHLRSDVTVGAALSGGVDSSSVVMAMRHLGGDRIDLRTVSYAADDPALNEASWVELVGRTAGAAMSWAKPSAADLVADLDRLIAVHDEPFGSPSIYAQYRVFQAAREAGIKVMLDGQGADEILGGYRSFLAARLIGLLRQGRLGEAMTLARHAAALPSSSAREVLIAVGARLVPAAGRDLARRLVGRELFPRWLNQAWLRERGAVRSPLPETAGREAVREQVMAMVFRTSLPMLLRYEDRNSMAFSIESRVPFLTPDLCQFLLSLPPEYLVAPDATTKAVFRRAMRGIVPDAVLDRRDKIGFATPEKRWLLDHAEWVDDVLGSEAARAIPAFDAAQARAEWERIRRRGEDFDSRVWRWINLIRWSEQSGVRHG